jgi:hypothetical protein
MFRSCYWNFFYPFYSLIKSDKKVKELVFSFGGCGIDLKVIKQKKSSDTLFICGTGQSINNLSESDWELISQHDSVGINNFCLKKIPTTFYSLELEMQDCEIHLERWERNARVILNHTDVFSNTLFLVRPYSTQSQIIKDLLHYLSQRKFMWHRVDYLPGRNVAELVKYLKFYKLIGFSRSKFYFPSRGSSLSWILFLAHKLKYKNIILVGIDLHGKHFWQDDRPLIDSKICFSNIHETQTQISGFSVSKIIDCYKKTILKDAQIFVATKYSLLSDSLPIYFKKN